MRRRTERVELVLTPREKQTLLKQAKRHDLSLSEWIRLALIYAQPSVDTAPRASSAPPSAPSPARAFAPRTPRTTRLPLRAAKQPPLT